jgi:starvation-inducible DNA-binding protein
MALRGRHARGTADLYTRLIQVHQKSCWFLNEILQKRDGLTS